MQLSKKYYLLLLLSPNLSNCYGCRFHTFKFEINFGKYRKNTLMSEIKEKLNNLKILLVL